MDTIQTVDDRQPIAESLYIDSLHFWREEMHDTPGNEVSKSANDEDNVITGADVTRCFVIVEDNPY
jgi:hypothetical protein